MIESVDIMSEIYELEQIRRRISERYRSDPNIRINVSLRQPKAIFARCSGEDHGRLSAHFFRWRKTSSGKPKRHALQYADVLTRDIELWIFERWACRPARVS